MEHGGCTKNYIILHVMIKYMRIRIFIFLISFLFISKPALFASPIDSIGSEVINGKVYVLHQVEDGETVYSISTKYKVRMRDIVAVSPEVKKGLAIGMVIKVPYVGVNVSKNKSEHHVVKAGETLYGISKLYKVSIDELMEWNDLSSSGLSIGQKLMVSGSSSISKSAEVTVIKVKGNLVHIVTQGEGLYGIARIYNVSVDQLIEWNQLQSTSLVVGQEIVVGLNANANYVHPIKIDTAQVSLSRRYEIEKVIEAGLAAIIDDTNNTNKYFALHRTATVGTIIAVRNEMNDQMVFVRVVGKLPNTGVNTKVVIRISDAAYKKLGAIDSKFRVQLSYLPNR